jgi:hypothetical protein
METPENFNAANYIEDMSKAYPLVEMYFTRDQSELMDSIDELYTLLNIENEIIPITVTELLNV